MEYPIITKEVGLRTYIDNGRTILADAATFMDYGKQGVTRIYTVHREDPGTEEERVRNREEFNNIANRVLRACGVW